MLSVVAMVWPWNERVTLSPAGANPQMVAFKVVRVRVVSQCLGIEVAGQCVIECTPFGGIFSGGAAVLQGMVRGSRCSGMPTGRPCMGVV
jgi:hypothetical protein